MKSNIVSLHSLNVLAFSTSLSLIWVNLCTRYGIGLSGLIKKSILSTIFPLYSLHAPNSIIESCLDDKPVVSKSNTVYVASFKSISAGLYTHSKYGSTTLNSHPYNTLSLQSSSFFFISSLESIV